MDKNISYWLLLLIEIEALGGSVVKNLPAMQETLIWSLGQKDPLKKAMATHSIILACKIPWTEEPDGLQSMGSQKSPTWLRDQTAATEINELLHVSGVYRALCVRSGGPGRKGNGGCMCYKMSSIFQNLCKGRSVVWNLAPPREIPPLPEHLAGNH